MLALRRSYCRDLGNCSMVDMAGRCCSFLALVCLGRLVRSYLPVTCYLLKIKERVMYTNTDKAIDCLCAAMWVAMIILLMGI